MCNIITILTQYENQYIGTRIAKRNVKSASERIMPSMQIRAINME